MLKAIIILLALVSVAPALASLTPEQERVMEVLESVACVIQPEECDDE